MSQVATAPVYSLDKVKTAASLDGGSFDARLLRNGLPVAEIVDDGWGGPLMFHWLDASAPKVAITHTPPGLKAPVTYQGTPEEARLRAYVDTLPPFTVKGCTEPMAMCPDVFVGDMVSQIAQFKATRTYLGYFAGPDFSINPDQTGAVQIWYQRFEIEVQNRLVR